MSTTKTCSWCGQSGHYRPTCPVPFNASQCSVCHKHGHDKRNCPEK